MTIIDIIQRSRKSSGLRILILLVVLLVSTSFVITGCSSLPNKQEDAVTTPAPSSASNDQATTDSQTIQDLSSYLERLSTQGKFSGVALVAKDNEILFEQAYGYANHAFNAPNNIDTKFNMASVGKMFTAVAIMQLIQDGKLSLDDTLIELVPDYLNKEAASKITVQQLLTHTSGLGDSFAKEDQDWNSTQNRTMESLIPLFVDKPLLFEPEHSIPTATQALSSLG